MTPSFALSRRSALAAAAGIGVSVTFLGRQAFAAVDGDLARRKLVVIVCRGAMDGLSVSPPVGDANYRSLRGEIAIAGFDQPGGALRLDDTFGLHPKLETVHALALKGQARIAPAVATPDRARSHFEAQDVLESGSSVVYGASSGWLNRAMESLAPRKMEAISVGAQAPLILRGRSRPRPGRRAAIGTATPACPASSPTSTPMIRCWARPWPRACNRGHGQGRRPRPKPRWPPPPWSADVGHAGARRRCGRPRLCPGRPRGR